MALGSMLDTLRAHLPADRVDRLIRRFRSDAAELVQQMRNDIDDPPTLGRTVHRLRGKSLVIGAEPLADLCAGLERDPSADDRRAQIQAIETEVLRLDTALSD